MFIQKLLLLNYSDKFLLLHRFQFTTIIIPRSIVFSHRIFKTLMSSGNFNEFGVNVEGDFNFLFLNLDFST